MIFPLSESIQVSEVMDKDVTLDCDNSEGESECKLERLRKKTMINLIRTGL